MTAQDFEQPVPVSQYGRQRRAAWLAGLQANADDMTAAAMQAHQQDHDVVTSGQHGIFGPGDSPQQLAADVAARAVRIGQDYGGGGRPLETLGGTFDPRDVGSSPAPARADLRNVGMPPGHQIGESPLAAYMRARNQ
jgi:hypothetical protein